MMVAFWVALTLAAPPAAREFRRRLAERLAGWEEEAAFWGQAAYGILPFYGAWITGAVIGRDCGISGFAPLDWVRGLVICAVLLGITALGLRYASVRRAAATWFNPQGSWLVLFDEPRWGFYRGAGAAAVPVGAVPQLIGLALGVVEWLIRNGRPGRATPPLVWSGLLRLGISAGLFALTHNLWLILLTQAAAMALVLRAKARPSPTG